MAITKLNTYENIPIGKENFEDYTTYLSDSVARSNPFIETTSTDLNDIVVIGSGYSAFFDSSDLLYVYSNELTIDNFSPSVSTDYTSSRFLFKPVASTIATNISSENTLDSTGSFSVFANPSDETGNYMVRIAVEEGAENSAIKGSFVIRANSTDISEEFFINAEKLSSPRYFYASFYSSDTAEITVDFTESLDSTDGSIKFTTLLYKNDPWESGYSYLINYKVVDYVFSSGLSGRLNVYYGDEKLLSAYETVSKQFLDGADYVTLIDSVSITPNNDTLGSLIFKPSQTYENGCIIFELDPDLDFQATVKVIIEDYKLIDSNIISLSGTSTNSFAFITDDEKRLFSLKTDQIYENFSSPSAEEWETPISSIESIVINEEIIGFGYYKEFLPPIFSRLLSPSDLPATSSDYISARSSTRSGRYGKGLVLATINGIPQLNDDMYTYNGIYDESILLSSDIFIFNSLRLGAEYPKPVYTNKINHQYANEVITGFRFINSSQVNASDSLANEDFQNTLYFPNTDFLLSPTLILIHYDYDPIEETGVERYYYIPMDKEFNASGDVLPNHYKVEDPSSGKVKFNFNLNIQGEGDRFWIVSAEQLQESFADGVSSYYSKYGNLYSPTANFNLTTKLVYFNPNSIINTNLSSVLPSLELIPLTKVNSFSGGSLIEDSEGEFSNSVLFALSYPGLVDGDELIRIQLTRDEPDVIKFYAYADSTASSFVEGEVPYPVYVQLHNNDISWYNRGIISGSYDPISRAVKTTLGVMGNESIRPENSATLAEIRRRSTLSSYVSIIGPADTTFMGLVTPNKFLASNQNSKIISVNANKGSLLVGSGVGNAPPRELNIGTYKQVLTASTDDVIWENISTAAWTTATAESNLGFYSFNATDKSNLNFVGATDQINILLSETITPTDYSNTLLFSLSTDVVIFNLEVTNEAILPPNGVVPGDYGSSTAIPTITVGSDGRLTFASDILIDTTAWTSIWDGNTTIQAGITDTLKFTGELNQIVVTAGVVSGTDTVNIALSTDVTIQKSISSPTVRIPHSTTEPGATDGNIWTTSTDASLIMGGVLRKFAFVNYHEHNASDITSGILGPDFGGTGFGDDYYNGELLIGNTSTNAWSKSTLTAGSGGLVISNGPGSITLSTNATNLNTPSSIVYRDASGNFVAGSITASLIGNASTATTLQTSRTINSVSFNGSADITVPTANQLTFGFGMTRTSFDGLNARTIAVSTDEVVTIQGAQTISGAKTFQTLILPVKS